MVFLPSRSLAYMSVPALDRTSYARRLPSGDQEKETRSPAGPPIRCSFLPSVSRSRSSTPFDPRDDRYATFLPSGEMTGLRSWLSGVEVKRLAALVLPSK